MVGGDRCSMRKDQEMPCYVWRSGSLENQIKMGGNDEKNKKKHNLKFFNYQCRSERKNNKKYMDLTYRA